MHKIVATPAKKTKTAAKATANFNAK